MATRQLDGLPSVLARYPRAILPLVPFADRLPGIPGHGGTLPATELAVDGVTVDPSHLARYAAVCGFPTDGPLPPTYPHVLAFPLHMALMTDGAFPFAPVGLVHITNTITTHRPIGAGDTLDLRVRAVAGPPHTRGRTFTLLTTATAGGDVVWEGASTMLRPGGGGASGRAAPSSPRDADGALDGGAAETWSLADDLGRRYAAASGDRNPIHLHALSARLFGFPRAIAHGMWTKARALAALGPLPDAIAVDVTFRAPILLPAQVAFTAATTPQTTQFAVGDTATDRVHLRGELRPHDPRSTV